jgi:hypothetical protein
MRIRPAIAALLALVAFQAGAQTATSGDVRLRGAFAPLLAPEGDARPATGEVRLRVEDDGDARVDLVVSGLTERATAATLHLGRSSEGGEQVARMDVIADGSVARVVGATTRLSPLVAGRVRDGEAYVLLRTNEHPDGLLRAPLGVQPRSLESVAAGE